MIEKTITKVDAVLSFLGTSGWSMVGETVIYDDPTDPNNPTEDELFERKHVLIQEYKTTLYQRLRAVEYKKLNQDEMRFDDLMNNTTTWSDAILAIKAMYPKGYRP